MLRLSKYRASKELEEFLKHHAGPHYVCDDSKCHIDTLGGLVEFRALHGDDFKRAILPVFPYKEDSPFSPVGDAAYQAYHDRLHATHGFQFDMGGEYRLACYHYEHARSEGLSHEDGLVLFHNVASRVMYHYYHNGNDPICRATFISACLGCCNTGPYVCKHSARGDYEIQYAGYTT